MMTFITPFVRTLTGRGRALVDNVISAPRVRGIIAPTVLAENSSTTDGTSFAFAESASPAANRLLLLAVGCAHATAAEVPNSVSAYGLTWTQAPGTASGTVTFNSGVRRLTWFYSWGTAPSTGTVTIGFATTHTYCIYSVVSMLGAGLLAPRQSTSNTAAGATTVTGTLLTLEYAFNAHVYALLHNANEGAAPPAAGGWSELSDRGVATPVGSLELGWTRSGDLTADPTWATSIQAGIVSLEIRAA